MCKKKYEEARTKFFKWLSNGRIRSGEIYQQMKDSRKLFQNALNYCKYNEQQLRDESMAQDFASGKTSQLRKKVKCRRGNTAATTVCVDEERDPARIADLFATKFSQVNGGGNSIIEENLTTTQTPLVQRFLARDIKRSVEKLKDGCGRDGLHAKHLKFLDSNNLLLLKTFYNAC